MLDDWGGYGILVAPPHEMSISIKEPCMVLDVAGKKTIFLIDMGATYSFLVSHAGPLFSKSCTVTGVNRKPRSHFLTGPLTCQFEQRLIPHGFLVVPECPIPLLGRDLLGSLGTTLQLGGPKKSLFLTLTKTNQLEEQGSIPSHILHTVNPAVWDKGIPGKAINA